MIVELGSETLRPDVWGNKIARLARLAAAGFCVPPGLCLRGEALRGAASASALGAWLSVTKPSRVVLRTSLPTEDTTLRALAGYSVSVLDVGAVVTQILEALHTRVLADASSSSVAAGGPGGAVLIQQQIFPQAAGVAFSTGDGLVNEWCWSSTDAVTSGQEPEVRMHSGNTGTMAELATWQQAPLMRLERAVREGCDLLKNLFGVDVDVEWSWNDGHLVVLQVRPVTAALWRAS